MKFKSLIYTSACLITSLLFSGCEDYFDINKDPNAIASSDQAIPMNNQLAGIEAEWALVNHGELVKYSSFWTCFRSYDGSILSMERMILTPTDGNLFWNPYVGSLRDANILYKYADSQGDLGYKSIAAIIMAQNWAFLTDCFDDIPCSEALQYPEIAKPKFDTQEEVYTVVFNLLNQAIIDLSATSTSSVGSGDYMYSGDLSKWLKLAYSLRARYNMRLWYRTGSVENASLIVSDINNGIGSKSDNALFPHSTGSTSRSFWAYDYQADYSGKGFVASPFIINLMKSFNDPRLGVYFDKDAKGGYSGWIQGRSSTDTTWASHASSTLITDEFPETIMDYSEALFIKAEAYLLAGDFTNAKAAFEAAVTYSLQAYGISESDISTYLSQFTFPTDTEEAQELIITQKYLAAFFTNAEPLFDYIRTGYPNFGNFSDYIDNPGSTTTTPIRLYYPQIEEDRNPENTPNADDIDIFSTKVWWDHK